jgi:hypothetical protein
MVMHPELAGAGITRNANVLPQERAPKGENRPGSYGAYTFSSVATTELS